jgi:hypothetical protein
VEPLTRKRCFQLGDAGGKDKYCGCRLITRNLRKIRPLRLSDTGKTAERIKAEVAPSEALSERPLPVPANAQGHRIASPLMFRLDPFDQ